MTLGSVTLAAGRAGTAALQLGLRAAGGTRRRVAQVDGLTVPYLERPGRREAPEDVVVLVHGFGGDKDNWALLAPLLSRRRRLLALDLPGYGEAPAIPADRATLPAQAAHLRAFLDATGVRRAHLVGHSMGGGIVQRLAADAPERVRTLTLLGSMGPKPVPGPLDHALARGENLLLPTDLAQTDAYLAFIAERLPPLPRPIRLFAVHQTIEARDQLASYFDKLHGAKAWPGLPADLSALGMPTRVIHGQLDQVVPLTTAQALAAGLPRTTLHVLPGIGHCPQLEAPRAVARLVDRFLDAH